MSNSARVKRKFSKLYGQQTNMILHAFYRARKALGADEVLMLLDEQEHYMDKNILKVLISQFTTYKGWLSKDEHKQCCESCGNVRTVWRITDLGKQKIADVDFDDPVSENNF